MESLLREALDLHMKGKGKEADSKVAAYLALYEKHVEKLK